MELPTGRCSGATLKTVGGSTQRGQRLVDGGISKGIAFQCHWKAIAYILPCWEKLNLYTNNGIMQIENKPVENAIRLCHTNRW